MSFSSAAKEEIVQQKIRSKGEKLALLCGILGTAGSLTLRPGMRFGVRFTTEHYLVGKHIAQLISGMYEVEVEIALREQERLNSRTTQVRIDGEEVMTFLQDVGTLKTDEEGMHIVSAPESAMTDTPAKKKAFVRGAFLGGGSVSNPKRAYHFEFVCNTVEFADTLADLLNEYDLNAKVLRRKGRYVVYLKEADAISTLLTLLGSNSAVLEFEQQRVVKDMRNYINRTNNCETSNLSKTVRASVQQREDIMLLLGHQPLETLPQQLRMVAEARLNYPEASLQELSEILNISRSGINHRLQKLSALAREIRMGKGNFDAT